MMLYTLEERKVQCGGENHRMEYITHTSFFLFLLLVPSINQSIIQSIIQSINYSNNSIGLIVGYVFCSILMSVVGSAVNTVIVCYAESPAEFQANHPQLSAEMRAAWVQAWPSLVD